MANLLSKYVVPGCRVDLQAVGRVRRNADGGEGHKVYQSQVIEVLSEDRVEITMPVEQSKLVLLPIDKELDLRFYSDNGVYQCFARVAERYKNGSIHIVVLDLTSNLRRHQRRDYYRFSCALEMGSRRLEASEEAAYVERGDVSLNSNLPMKKGIIVDISGGGLRFVSKFTYEPQSLILCRYELAIEGEMKEYNLLSRVLSVKEAENRPGVYEHRIQFVDMDATEREEIIKYIFDEERKALRKRKTD